MKILAIRTFAVAALLFCAAVSYAGTIRVVYIGPNVTGVNRDPMPGESVLVVDRGRLTNGFRARYYKVMGGQVIPKDDSTIQAEEDVKTLAVKRASKRLEIEAAFLEEDGNSTITAGGSTYDASREHLREIYIEALLAKESGESAVVVFDTDGGAHTLSVAGAKSAVQKIRQKGRARLRKIKTKMKAIRDAQTLSDIESITWE